MSFRENLQHLRDTRNMTQEQLAMLLGVSRQSVSKWEAEKAYPEMDKLIKIRDIFGCTLDELVQGDLSDRAADPELALDQATTPADMCGYDEVMLRTAHRIAAGVGIIIVGVGAAGFLDDAPSLFPPFSHDAGPALAMFGGIAAGLALILPATFERSAFSKEHPFVEDFYTGSERIAAKKRMGAFIAGGIALIMLGMAMGATFAHYAGLAAIGFFAPVGAGVALIVDAAMVSGRMDVEAYNYNALGELSDAELGALDDPNLAHRARERRRDGYVYGAIMLGATIVALLWLFLGCVIDEQSTAVTVFWLPWPIGGLACALVALVKKARG